MTIKLHVFPLSPRGFKVLFAAHQLGIDYEFVPVDFSKQAQKTPGFTALNPNQRMPVLEDGDYCLWESNAIVQYLAALKPHSGMMPADLKARMTAVKWQFWESAHWDPAVAIYMFENVVKKLFGMGPPDAAEIERGAALIARLAPVLDGQLAKTRYAAGDTLTVADISLGATLVRGDEAGVPLGEYRGIQRWRADIAALPGWRAAVALMKG
ncbi:MAG: glutathione S-transferase family protein [Proteobacteria bacterium]|nr:glutathione S-transferase family protein [Pseudomonadota bacterium]